MSGKHTLYSEFVYILTNFEQNINKTEPVELGHDSGRQEQVSG